MDFAIRNLDHVVLRVRDLDRAIAFYRDVLGCSEERRIDGIGLVMMRAGASMIDLQDSAKAPPKDDGANMDHLCLRIDPFDEAALARHLDSHGVAHGPAEMRFGADGRGPSIYIADPDGNTVELKGPPEG